MKFNRNILVILLCLFTVACSSESDGKNAQNQDSGTPVPEAKKSDQPQAQASTQTPAQSQTQTFQPVSSTPTSPIKPASPKSSAPSTPSAPNANGTGTGGQNIPVKLTRLLAHDDTHVIQRTPDGAFLTWEIGTNSDPSLPLEKKNLSKFAYFENQGLTVSNIAIHSGVSMAIAAGDIYQWNPGKTQPKALLKPSYEYLPNIRFKSVVMGNDWNRAITETGHLFVWKSAEPEISDLKLEADSFSKGVKLAMDKNQDPKFSSVAFGDHWLAAVLADNSVFIEDSIHEWRRFENPQGSAFTFSSLGRCAAIDTDGTLSIGDDLNMCASDNLPFKAKSVVLPEGYGLAISDQNDLYIWENTTDLFDDLDPKKVDFTGPNSNAKVNIETVAASEKAIIAVSDKGDTYLFRPFEKPVLVFQESQIK